MLLSEHYENGDSLFLRVNLARGAGTKGLRQAIVITEGTFEAGEFKKDYNSISDDIDRLWELKQCLGG